MLKEFDAEINKIKESHDGKIAEMQKHVDAVDARMKSKSNVDKTTNPVGHYYKSFQEALADNHAGIKNIRKGQGFEMEIKATLAARTTSVRCMETAVAWHGIPKCPPTPPPLFKLPTSILHGTISTPWAWDQNSVRPMDPRWGHVPKRPKIWTAP